MTRLILLLVCVPVLCGCAAMSTSVMDTAEPLPQGHARFGTEYGTGLELTSTVLLSGDESGTFDADALAAIQCYGFYAGFGLTDRLELDAKVWASIGGAGFRLNGKYALSEPGGRSCWAIAPGVNAVTTGTDEEDGGSLDEYIADVSTMGLELPVLATHRFNDHLAVTATARYAVDLIEISFPEDSPLADLNDVYTLHRVGFVNGWTLCLGAFRLQPEIGVELAKQVNGDFGVVPVFAVGAGFQF